MGTPVRRRSHGRCRSPTRASGRRSVSRRLPQQQNKSGLALDTISADSVSQHTGVWEKVVRKLRARYMTADLSPKQVKQLAKVVKEEFGDEAENV
jgi:hypothetical protein